MKQYRRKILKQVLNKKAKTITYTIEVIADGETQIAEIKISTSEHPGNAFRREIDKFVRNS